MMPRFLVFAVWLVVSVAPASAQIVLVKPETTARIAAPEASAAQIELWTTALVSLLREAGVSFAVEGEDCLTRATPKSTIILPRAVALSSDQLKALREHLNEGNGLWITSATGFQDETGAVRGWEFLREIIPGEIDSADYPPGSPVSLQMRFGRPGSSGLPPGYRLRLAPYETLLSIRTENPEDVAAYWARDKYIEEPPDSISRLPGLISRTTLSGGRIVWFGAGLEGLHIDPVNKEMALKSFKELIGWLEGGGIPSIDAWPDGRRAAVLIHGDMEDKFESISRLTDLFKRLKVPVTYNILTAEATRYPRAVEAMRHTEAEFAIHGDTHQLFTGQSFEEQTRRLKTAIGFVALTDSPPTSFRPPELAYDDNTLRAAKNAGFTAILAHQAPDRDYPIYGTQERSTESGLVFFPKSELDDFDLFNRPIFKSAGSLEKLLIDDFKRIYDLKGLYKLNFHSQYLARSELPSTIEATLIEIKGHDDVWFADARSISQWIRQRSRLLMQSASDNATIRLTLTNTSAEMLRGVVLRVLPPQNVPAELLVPLQVSENCQYDVRDGVLFVEIPPMKAGALFKMEIGSSGGRALSLVNKSVLMTGLKAFGALGAIFIIWFIMYLAFSGKKFRKVKGDGHNSDNGGSALSLSGELAPRHTPLAGENGASGNGHQGEGFPVIPSLTPGGLPTTPSVGVSLTIINPRGNDGQFHKAGPGVLESRSVRNTRLPSLPMVMKPITFTIRPEPKIRRERKSETKQSAANPENQSASPGRADPGQSEAKISSHTRQKSSAKIVETTSVVPSTADMHPVNASSTFRSPSGLRTTARLPRLKPVIPSVASRPAGEGGFDQAIAAQESDNQGRVRTSIDVIRRKQTVAAGKGEEWR